MEPMNVCMPCGSTVEPMNKGHFGTALFVLCKEVVLFGRLETYKHYMEELFWDLKLCPLWKGLLYCVLVWESPLSEVHCMCIFFVYTLGKEQQTDTVECGVSDDICSL